MTDLGDIQLQDLSREEAINLVRVLQDQVQAKNTEIAALRCVTACCRALKTVLDGYHSKISCGAEASAVTMFWSFQGRR